MTQVRIILPDIGAERRMPQTKHPANQPLLLTSVTLASLAPRAQSSHKGDFGHVLVVGGDRGTGGAVLLSAEAALRCGAGLVSLATRSEHVPAALARLPEAMVLGISSANQLMGLLQKVSVLVVGPGLGQSSMSVEFDRRQLDTSAPASVGMAGAGGSTGLQDALHLHVVQAGDHRRCQHAGVLQGRHSPVPPPRRRPAAGS